MAGLGAKLFASFSKLTAAQVNGYLMDQSIMRFATSVARDAAFGGAGEPTLAEGMTCYLDDTNEIQSYTGSAWVSVAASSTVADVSSGLVYIDSKTLATATTDFVGCFTNTYDNYKIVITEPQVNSAADIYFRLLDGTTPIASGYYYVALGANVAGTIQNTFSGGAAQNEFYTGWTTTSGGAGTEIGGLVFDILSPKKAKRTVFTGSLASYQTNWKHATSSGIHGDATVCSGLRISTLTAATLTGTATLYGYRKP